MTTEVKRKPTTTKVERLPVEIFIYVFDSDFDWMAIAWSKNGVRALSLGRSSPQEALTSLKAASDHPPYASLKQLPKEFADVVAKLQRYVAGKEVDLSSIPLDLGHLTSFQRRVINACRRIPRGKVLSYQELGGKAGSPRSARAVGNVMRNNCVPLIVPCHRVVGSNGLGGYFLPLRVDDEAPLAEARGAGNRLTIATRSASEGKS